MKEKSSTNIAEIKFQIEQDDQHIPVKMRWWASGEPQGAWHDCKSLMISIWDHQKQDTLRIDLWTRDMPVDEMNRHFIETLLTLAESYHKATRNPIIIEEMKRFCEEFIKKTNALNKKEQNPQG